MLELATYRLEEKFDWKHREHQGFNLLFPRLQRTQPRETI